MRKSPATKYGGNWNTASGHRQVQVRLTVITGKAGGHILFSTKQLFGGLPRMTNVMTYSQIVTSHNDAVMSFIPANSKKQTSQCWCDRCGQGVELQTRPQFLLTQFITHHSLTQPIYKHTLEYSVCTTNSGMLPKHSLNEGLVQLSNCNVHEC